MKVSRSLRRIVTSLNRSQVASLVELDDSDNVLNVASRIEPAIRHFARAQSASLDYVQVFDSTR